MSETLTIQNFGPIRNVKDLKLKKINVFIGDQGTGKSTLAKLLMTIQDTVFREKITLDWVNRKLETKTESFKEYLKANGIDTYLTETTNILYESDYLKFTFINGKVDSLLKTEKLNERSIGYDSTYIPAERILVSTLANALYSLMLNEVSLPKLFLKFGEKFQKGREQKSVFDFQNILDIDYKYAGDRDIVVMSSGKEILMEHASSGIQSSIPLLIVFDSVLQKSKYNNLLIIEEPELNCFPETQNKLIRHLLETVGNDFVDGEKQYKKQLLLTTHSPYILTSLNNLMYAYQTGQKHAGEVEKVVPKENWINPADVSAYMMLPNGECESILDDEGLIKAEKIDSVSSVLNKDFNAIMDIELSINQ